MSPLQIVIAAAIAAALLLAGDLALRRLSWSRRERQARTRAERLVADGESRARSLQREAELSAREIREQAESEALERREAERAREQAAAEEVADQRQALDRDRDRIRGEAAALDRERRRLADAEAEGRRLSEELDRRETSIQSRLEEIAGLSREQALEQLRRELVEEARQRAAQEMQRVLEEARAGLDERLRESLSKALQKVRMSGVVESTVSVVRLPSDDMKGRIIGREGRNIRSIEMTTGIDLIVDDTPGTITLSCFDPLRRETARIAIERLVEDGRIHPARIEELVEKTRTEMEEVIRETGETTAFDLGVQDLHPRLVRLLGKLKYHTDRGQNLLQHCREAADLAGLLALELGVPPEVPRRAALLHEIAQAAEEQVGSPSIPASGELAVRHGESPEVQQAIAAAHPDATPRQVEGALVRLACRISRGRIGARKHNLEVFMSRQRRLETVALSCPGVRAAYAFRAGKELRVLVDSGQLSDKETVALSREIADRLRREVDLPGEVKVSVLRETRAVDFAL